MPVVLEACDDAADAKLAGWNRGSAGSRSAAAVPELCCRWCVACRRRDGVPTDRLSCCDDEVGIAGGERGLGLGDMLRCVKQAGDELSLGGWGPSRPGRRSREGSRVGQSLVRGTEHG